MKFAVRIYATETKKTTKITSSEGAMIESSCSLSHGHYGAVNHVNLQMRYFRFAKSTEFDLCIPIFITIMYFTMPLVFVEHKIASFVKYHSGSFKMHIKYLQRHYFR